MTTARKPAPAGPDAVKALLDVITGGNGTIEAAHAVTLPGRPVTVHLSAEEVAAYLLATGWRERRPDKRWRSFTMHRWFEVLVPTGEPLPLITVAAALTTIADHENRHPLDVAEAIIARRGGKQADGDDARGKWTRDADEALRLADAASPDWNMGGVDAGDGRKIIADGEVPLDHIRVSTMSAGGRSGGRLITVAQRDADARFIAAARVGWPRDANRVRLLCAEVDRLRSGGKAKGRKG